MNFAKNEEIRNGFSELVLEPMVTGIVFGMAYLSTFYFLKTKL